MSIDKLTVVLQRFLEILWANSVQDVKILQSFLVAFNKQVQNSDKTKASFLRLYRV